MSRSHSEGNRCGKLDLSSEAENEIQKEVLEETRTRIAYSLKKYISPPYRLHLSTFRPLSCPMPLCNLPLCPSALLIHLQQCHRDLPSSELELTGDISSFDIYERLSQLEPLKPTPIHLFKVNDGIFESNDPEQARKTDEEKSNNYEKCIPLFGAQEQYPALQKLSCKIGIGADELSPVKHNRYPEFPVLLQMCWLSKKEIPALTSERWLAAWLSCLYIVPMWFRLQFVAYSPTQTAIAYICKASETNKLMSPNEIAESTNTMLVQEKSLARLYSDELSLYIEVNTYGSKNITENSLSISN